MATTPITIGGQQVTGTLPAFDGTTNAVPGSGFLHSIATGNPLGDLLNSAGHSLGLGSIGSSLSDTLGLGLPNDSGQGYGAQLGSVDWLNIFLRGVIIVLGFIFVAVGLSMFKSPQTLVINSTGNAIRNTVKKTARGK